MNKLSVSHRMLSGEEVIGNALASIEPLFDCSFEKESNRFSRKIFSCPEQLAYATEPVDSNTERCAPLVLGQLVSDTSTQKRRSFVQMATSRSALMRSTAHQHDAQGQRSSTWSSRWVNDTENKKYGKFLVLPWSAYWLGLVEEQKHFEKPDRDVVTAWLYLATGTQ